MRDELAFARSLSASQRRTVHLVAKKLGLEHRSIGEGEERHVVVFKGGVVKEVKVRCLSSRGWRRADEGWGKQQLRHSASTLGRSSSRDVLSSYLSPEAYSSPNTAHLRGKKSMPDIRYTSSSSASSNSYSHAPAYAYHHQQSPSHHPHQQQQQQANQRRSNLNLREGYKTVGTAARSRPSVQGIFQGNNFFESSSSSAPPPPSPSHHGGATAQTATQYYSSDASSSPSLSLSLAGGVGESSATSEEGSLAPNAHVNGGAGGGGGGAGAPFVVRQPRGPGGEGSWRGGSE